MTPTWIIGSIALVLAIAALGAIGGVLWVIRFMAPTQKTPAIPPNPLEFTNEMKRRRGALEVFALVSPDGRRARLVVQDAEGTHCEVEITADEIIDGIMKLGSARAAMGEAPAPDLEPTTILPQFNNSSWRIPAYTVKGDRLLLLYNHFMGWISYRYNQKEANEIAKWLTTEVEDRPEPPPVTNR
jgi:hypothetical protein